MRILFDQGTPVPLKQHFPDHQVQTAFELGWSRLQKRIDEIVKALTSLKTGEYLELPS